MGGKPRLQPDLSKPLTPEEIETAIRLGTGIRFSNGEYFHPPPPAKKRGRPKAIYFEEHAEADRDALADVIRRAEISVKLSQGSGAELSLPTAFFEIVEKGGLRPAWNPNEGELLAELATQHRTATECEERGVVPPSEEPPVWARDDCEVPPGACHSFDPRLLARLQGGKARFAVTRILDEAAASRSQGALRAERILAHLYRCEPRYIRAAIERAGASRKRREVVRLALYVLAGEGRDIELATLAARMQAAERRRKQESPRVRETAKWVNRMKIPAAHGLAQMLTDFGLEVEAGFLRIGSLSTPCGIWMARLARTHPPLAAPYVDE